MSSNVTCIKKWDGKNLKKQFNMKNWEILCKHLNKIWRRIFCNQYFIIHVKREDNLIDALAYQFVNYCCIYYIITSCPHTPLLYFQTSFSRHEVNNTPFPYMCACLWVCMDVYIRVCGNDKKTCQLYFQQGRRNHHRYPVLTLIEWNHIVINYICW